MLYMVWLLSAMLVHLPNLLGGDFNFLLIFNSHIQVYVGLVGGGRHNKSSFLGEVKVSHNRKVLRNNLKLG